jgi:hypothetical protein
MPLVILHHLLNVFVQLANKRRFTKKKVGFEVLTAAVMSIAVFWNVAPCRPYETNVLVAGLTN